MLVLLDVEQENEWNNRLLQLFYILLIQSNFMPVNPVQITL